MDSPAAEPEGPGGGGHAKGQRGQAGGVLGTVLHPIIESCIKDSTSSVCSQSEKQLYDSCSTLKF